MWVYTSFSMAETVALGERLGSSLPKGAVVALHGDLGAGKTLLVKGIALGAAGISPELVQSPTFVHMNVYEGKGTVYHFDLYRLKDESAFLAMGFDEYLFLGSLCCIEWAERIQEVLPAETLKISMYHLGGDSRRIEIPLHQAAKLWGKGTYVSACL